MFQKVDNFMMIECKLISDKFNKAEYFRYKLWMSSSQILLFKIF